VGANPIPSFTPSSNPALRSIPTSAANTIKLALEGTDRLALPNAVKGSPGRCKRDNAQAKHFDVDMNKHGLLDKIVHIQKLNDYFEVELGSNRKGSDSMQGTSEQPTATATATATATGNCAFENTLKGDMAKGFTFPFQKRARSQSPLRNAPLFGQNEADSPPNTRKPVLVTGNFVLGRDLRGLENFEQKESIEEFNTLLESEDCIDMAGLSTGPTDEERHAKHAKGMTVVEADDGWMYQRLEHAPGPGGTVATIQDPLIQHLLSHVNPNA
jgi:hypothetical protein